MKVPIFRIMLTFSTFISFAQVTTAASSPADQFGQTDNRNDTQKIRFKGPIVVPFDLLTEKQKSTIDKAENDLDRMLVLVFVGGKIIRAENYIEILENKGQHPKDYLKAFLYANPSGSVSSSNMNSLDISYCKVTAIMDGTRNEKGYTLKVQKDLYPFVNSRSRSSINFGDVVRTTYSTYVALSEEERPNEATIRGKSKQIPDIFCLRHSASNNGTRVQDFVQAIGADTAEVY